MRHIVTCDFCGEKRNTSTAYTSPQNAERDRQDWARLHRTGVCVQISSPEVAQAIAVILAAWRDTGPRPDLHRLAQQHLIRNWPALANALHKLDRAVR